MERHPILRQPPASRTLFAAALPQSGARAGNVAAEGRVVFVLKRLRARQEWQFFVVLPKADPVLATVWWALLILNGAMPALFAVAIGATVNVVQQASPVAVRLP